MTNTHFDRALLVLALATTLATPACVEVTRAAPSGASFSLEKADDPVLDCEQVAACCDGDVCLVDTCSGAEEVVDACDFGCDDGTCAAAVDPCCDAHGGLGCHDAVCEAAVCGNDDYCCQVEWDSVCAEVATEACGSCRDVPSDCCADREGAGGCDEVLCEASVCDSDAYCCDVKWDSLCAGVAVDTCASCSYP